MMRRVGRLLPWVRHLVQPVALLVLAVIQLRADARAFNRWQGWLDQSYYLQSARAWAALNVDPVQHHYPGGYSLLAAPFVYITPAQPFVVPDLLCAAASLVLFVRICRRLAPGLPAGDAIAAASFLVGSILDRRIVALWAIPWTTTAEAPLLLLCLLMALRFAETRRLAHAAGLGCAAGIAAFVRPSDAALMLCACAIFGAVQIVVWHVSARVAARCGAALGAGLAVGLLPAVATHLAIHGLSAGAYAAKSAVIGFDWRLIPLRWVTLVIDPQPLFTSGPGMAVAFPWFFSGCAGMVLAVCAGWRGSGWRGSRGPNALVAGAMVLSWCSYFAYRDLHAAGLWYYSNIHYFKWTFPFLVFWTVGLVWAVFEPVRRVPACASVAATCLLFAWRPVFSVYAHGHESAQPFSVVIPGGLSPLHRAVFLQLAEAGPAAYLGHAQMTVDGQSFVNTRDFKIFPQIEAGGMHAQDWALIMPLRDMPPGDASLTLPDGGQFAAQTAWVSGHWSLVFGVPCMFLSQRTDCRNAAASLQGDATPP
jgi:hypothetical protein